MEYLQYLLFVQFFLERWNHQCVQQSDLIYFPLCLGLQGIPGDYISQGGPMGMSMTQSSYTPSQMTPHPTQLEHGPQSIHICQVTPSPSHDDAWRILYPSWNDHFSTEPHHVKFYRTQCWWTAYGHSCPNSIKELKEKKYLKTCGL